MTHARASGSFPHPSALGGGQNDATISTGTNYKKYEKENISNRRDRIYWLAYGG